MKFLSYIAAIIANMVTTANASELTIMGFGVDSCAGFGEIYKTAPHDAERLYFGWAQGFMSGINLRT
jgi:hypothetical protein